MIIARLQNQFVEVEDAINGRALVRTLDGSEPFTAHIARSDPEESPLHEFTSSAWTWVDGKELTEVSQTSLIKAEVLATLDICDQGKDAFSALCSHKHVELLTTGGYHFDPETGPYDDIQEALICMDCFEEVFPPETISTIDESEQISF